ncbi:MAG: NAD(+) synthase, partial [Eggerthellaceae bacterium]|nr:NAD(+) synthase [Eggerthellaceae bacterium]
KGWMLINTGNKSEACMGYSTLYGDSAGAFAPLGGIYKTEVFALAEYINNQSGKPKEIIPDNILTKAPSAELAYNQTDEASLGIDYEHLDIILKLHVEMGLGPADIAAKVSDVDVAAVHRIVSTYASYAYKRAQLPPCPDVRFY